MIRVQGVTKIYGKNKNTFTALDDINLEIPSNTSVAILGKSGSGKSTMMHTLSGLDRVTTGSITINDVEITTMKPKQADHFRAKEMGFIFQSFFVEGGESCYNNVSLSLEMAQVPYSERRQRVEAALEAVDMSDKIKSKAQDLSGGQKQRLAIARAIVGEPKVLFADEPTGNLDSATAKVIEDLLFNYQKKRKATLIVVTHDEELAARCEMIVRIKDGKIESVSGGDSSKKPAKKPQRTMRRVQ